jgi:hypothetical protein
MGGAANRLHVACRQAQTRRPAVDLDYAPLDLHQLLPRR